MERDEESNNYRLANLLSEMKEEYKAREPDEARQIAFRQYETYIKARGMEKIIRANHDEEFARQNNLQKSTGKSLPVVLIAKLKEDLVQTGKARVKFNEKSAGTYQDPNVYLELERNAGKIRVAITTDEKPERKINAAGEIDEKYLSQADDKLRGAIIGEVETQRSKLDKEWEPKRDAMDRELTLATWRVRDELAILKACAITGGDFENVREIVDDYKRAQRNYDTFEVAWQLEHLSYTQKFTDREIAEYLNNSGPARDYDDEISKELLEVVDSEQELQAALDEIKEDFDYQIGRVYDNIIADEPEESQEEKILKTIDTEIEMLTAARTLPDDNPDLQPTVTFTYLSPEDRDTGLDKGAYTIAQAKRAIAQLKGNAVRYELKVFFNNEYTNIQADEDVRILQRKIHHDRAYPLAESQQINNRDMEKYLQRHAVVGETVEEFYDRAIAAFENDPIRAYNENVGAKTFHAITGIYDRLIDEREIVTEVTREQNRENQTERKNPAPSLSRAAETVIEEPEPEPEPAPEEDREPSTPEPEPAAETAEPEPEPTPRPEPVAPEQTADPRARAAILLENSRRPEIQPVFTINTSNSPDIPLFKNYTLGELENAVLKSAGGRITAIVNYTYENTARTEYAREINTAEVQTRNDFLDALTVSLNITDTAHFHYWANHRELSRIEANLADANNVEKRRAAHMNARRTALNDGTDYESRSLTLNSELTYEREVVWDEATWNEIGHRAVEAAKPEDREKFDDLRREINIFTAEIERDYGEHVNLGSVIRDPILKARFISERSEQDRGINPGVLTDTFEQFAGIVEKDDMTPGNTTIYGYLKDPDRTPDIQPIVTVERSESRLVPPGEYTVSEFQHILNHAGTAHYRQAVWYNRNRPSALDLFKNENIDFEIEFTYKGTRVVGRGTHTIDNSETYNPRFWRSVEMLPGSGVKIKSMEIDDLIGHHASIQHDDYLARPERLKRQRNLGGTQAGNPARLSEAAKYKHLKKLRSPNLQPMVTAEIPITELNRNAGEYWSDKHEITRGSFTQRVTMTLPETARYLRNTKEEFNGEIFYTGTIGDEPARLNFRVPGDKSPGQRRFDLKDLMQYIPGNDLERVTERDRESLTRQANTVAEEERNIRASASEAALIKTISNLQTALMDNHVGTETHVREPAREKTEPAQKSEPSLSKIMTPVNKVINAVKSIGGRNQNQVKIDPNPNEKSEAVNSTNKEGKKMPNEKETRIYFDIPYPAINTAKRAGAIYDRDNQAWYGTNKQTVDELYRFVKPKDYTFVNKVYADLPNNAPEKPAYAPLPPVAPENRVYISVPFELKDTAKTAGWRWDGVKQQAYCDKNDLGKMKQFAEANGFNLFEKQEKARDGYVDITDRIYLKSEFKDRNELKALGAKWDYSVGHWYIGPDQDPAKFAKWSVATPQDLMQKPAKPKPGNNMGTTINCRRQNDNDSFRDIIDRMGEHGLMIDPSKINWDFKDGRRVAEGRCPTLQGKPGNANGWYKITMDPVPYLQMCNHNLEPGKAWIGPNGKAGEAFPNAESIERYNIAKAAEKKAFEDQQKQFGRKTESERETERQAWREQKETARAAAHYPEYEPTVRQPGQGQQAPNYAHYNAPGPDPRFEPKEKGPGYQQAAEPVFPDNSYDLSSNDNIPAPPAGPGINLGTMPKYETLTEAIGASIGNVTKAVGELAADKVSKYADKQAQYDKKALDVQRDQMKAYGSKDQLNQLKSNRYLNEKRVPPTPGVWVSRGSNYLNIGMFKFKPGTEELEMRTKQYIDCYKNFGEKKFEAGAEFKGSFHIVGGPEKYQEKQKPIIICEGYATAVTIDCLTDHNYRVVMAGTAGNIANVAQELRKREPNVKMIIAADNDIDKDLGINTGLQHATYAAKTANAEVIVPPVRNGSDYNDLFRELGPDQAKAIINEQVGAKLKTPTLEREQEQSRGGR